MLNRALLRFSKSKPDAPRTARPEMNANSSHKRALPKFLLTLRAMGRSVGLRSASTVRLGAKGELIQ